MKTSTNSKKLATLAMLAAMAYVVMFVCRIPIMPAAPYLKYDPKDVILAIAGFLFGPLEGAAAALVVAALEMVTVGTSGIWGFVMNLLASCAFVCPAALIYRRDHDLKGALLGLAVGIAAMTGTMLLWNYLITPIYQGFPREAVAAMLVPVFLPFNLIKAGINAAITLLLYKPVAGALRRAKLVPASAGEAPTKRGTVGVFIVAAVALVTLVLIILAMSGVI